MNISEISIRRPVFAWMLMTGLIVLGSIAFMRMGISQFPDVDFPVVSINIRLEGAAPEVIETEVVDVIEDAVMSIQGIRNVTSSSENSEGSVSIEFEIDRPIENAIEDVQAKMSQIQRRLPAEAKPPTISKVNPEDQPIIFLTLESDRHSPKELMPFVNDRLKNQFSMLAGVGDITLNGYNDPNMRIWVKPEKLDAFDLTVMDIINLLQKSNSESPGGQVDIGKRQLFVRTLGEATTVEEFEKLSFNQRGGKPLYKSILLKEVAKIEEGLADTTRINRANGATGVGIAIRKQRGSNAVSMAKEVRAQVVNLQKTLPEGMRLAVNFDSSRYIEEAVHELNFTLILSALLTALVCLLFLGSWSSMVNILMAIPTSVIGTFIVLYFSGFTLNTFTLLGLSLSIGIIVDDAIMVLENIIRHREMGKSKLEAALDGSKEITFAAIAATLSIVAIFLPVAFMSGVIGKFFFQFGITITAAVLLSLVEALTLTPMRCSQLGADETRTSRLGRFVEFFLDKSVEIYQRSLETALRFRWVVMALTVAFFSLSFFLAQNLKQEFMPPEDQSRFNIRLKTDIGSSLKNSDAKFSAVEKLLAGRPEVSRYVLVIGGGSPGDSNKGMVMVTMKNKGSRGVDPEKGHELSQREFMNYCREQLKKIPDLKAVLQDLSTRGLVASRGLPVEFTVQGPEWSELAKYSQEIMTELDKSGLVQDLDTDYQLGMPELHVIPDRDKATLRGVDISSIDATVNAMLGGIVVGTYPNGAHRDDIRLKIEESDKPAIEQIYDLDVRNNRGERVALRELVKIEEKSSVIEIMRKNRERAIGISANITHGSSQQEALKVVEDLGKRILAPGYYISFGGTSQTFNEAFESLIFALILGIFVAYMILASQFNSFFDPLTVLVALPLSLTGALGGLLLMGQTINIYSMIGFVLLMGIVKKNAILLVDFTKQTREKENLSVHAALIKACPKRLRPILMTSVATVVGALPAALAIGPGAESRIPMAIAIIGGVITSTLLTLYAVPCVYSLKERT